LEFVAGEIGADAEVCDVGNRDEVEETARRIAERHPAVQLLVNNAGIPGRHGFLELDPAQIEEVTRVNYLGSVWCLRAFLPLLEAGAPAHLVNVVSVAGTVAGGGSGPYTAAKHAQIAFSRSIGAELATRGIRVHTVNPGLTHTDGFPQDAFMRHPVWRHAVVDPDRVADAVLDALRLGRQEIFVPGYYRIATALQGLAPATVSRLAGRRVALRRRAEQ
jgi:NAD(P)-dependent dehydrogenase (short-subunit alcohol dehydrogenase family)